MSHIVARKPPENHGFSVAAFWKPVFSLKTDPALIIDWAVFYVPANTV